MANTGVTKTAYTGAGLFRGLMTAQAAAIAVCSILAGLLGGAPVAIAAAWGGGICLLAHAWAGFQLWLHPGNRRSERRQASAAIRAEMGKIVIMLLLFWLTFREMPDMRSRETAAALFAGFFLTQVAGWIWLARYGDAPLAQRHAPHHDR